MAQNLLLISVDSPVLMGIYENCNLVKSFSAEGKFSDVLPRLFAAVLDFGADSADFHKVDCHADSANLLAMTENNNFAESNLDSGRICNIFYANGPGNFSAIKLTHIFLQTLSIVKNIPLFCADAFHFSNSEFINAYGKVHFYKKGSEIRTKTLSAKQQNHFFLPRVLDMSIFSDKCAPLYILPAV